jgi:FAD/FMN-containing dehydrogenase
VVATVDVARERGLVVAVRSAAHSLPGLSTCDDRMLIDLSGLKPIAVDPEERDGRGPGEGVVG